MSTDFDTVAMRLPGEHRGGRNSGVEGQWPGIVPLFMEQRMQYPHQSYKHMPQAFETFSAPLSISSASLFESFIPNCAESGAGASQSVAASSTSSWTPTLTPSTLNDSPSQQTSALNSNPLYFTAAASTAALHNHMTGTTCYRCDTMPGNTLPPSVDFAYLSSESNPPHTMHRSPPNVPVSAHRVLSMYSVPESNQRLPTPGGNRFIPVEQTTSHRHRLAVQPAHHSMPYSRNTSSIALRWPTEFRSNGLLRELPVADPTTRGNATESEPTPPLMPDHPAWRLTRETYDWMVATLDPKKRPDKSVPAPSGQCKLCPSVCQRSGTLQQHIITLHRQKIARKVFTKPKQRFNLELALGFVVAQLRSDHGVLASHPECAEFTTRLSLSPDGLLPVADSDFPFLREKLLAFSSEERWMGVKCQACGVLVTKRRVLEEQHLPLCSGTM